MDVSLKPLNTSSSQNFATVQVYTTSKSSPGNFSRSLFDMARDLASRLFITFLFYGAEETVNIFSLNTSLLTFNFLCQIAGLTSVSVQSVKDFLFDEELILLVTGRAFAQFFIFLVAIVPIYLFAITLYPTIREVLPSQSEHH